MMLVPEEKQAVAKIPNELQEHDAELGIHHQQVVAHPRMAQNGSNLQVVYVSDHKEAVSESDNRLLLAMETSVAEI